MARKARTRTTAIAPVPMVGYDAILTDVVRLLETARRAAARTVNAVMTATYWEIGRRIVEYEQGGRRRAEYGAEILHRLARDLTGRFGRGFGVDHLELMRAFYLTYPPEVVAALIGGKSESALRELPAPSALAPRSSQNGKQGRR